MRRHPRGGPWFRILACAWVLAGVGACSESPGYEDCQEWRQPGFVALQGELHMSFSSQVSGTSPGTNYKPHGWHDDTVAHVYGCALDAEGNLWRVQTYWGFPPATPPYPVVLDRDEDSDTVATFAGVGVMCEEAECSRGRGQIGVFTTHLELNPREGEGQVTEWKLSPTTLKAEVVVHPYFSMVESDSVITVDVTWPDE